MSLLEIRDQMKDMISELSRKAPCLSQILNCTGLGSDLSLIECWRRKKYKSGTWEGLKFGHIF